MKPSSDRKNAPQAMVVSIGERKRKSDGREYDTPPPLPCTLKELDVLLDKWIADGAFEPNQVSREPTEEERRDLRFCHLHNFVQHPTTKCWAFRRVMHRRIKEGTLELSQLEVERNTLSNHKEKGVVVVVICTDPGEDEKERSVLPVAAITTLQKKFQV